MKPFAAQPAARREWTTREVRYLREHYAADGAEAVSDALGRSLSSVYQHARKLDLHRPREIASSAFQPRWTSSEQIDAVIRRAFTGDATKGFVERCARAVGRPRWWVSKRAAALGLVAPRFKELPWSQTETELLIAHAKKSNSTIQAILHRHGFKRTLTAIGIRLKRSGIDRTDENRMTGRGLAEVMGVDGKTVSRWIEKGMLHAERRGTERVEAQGGDQWWIRRRDVRRFIVENVAAVDLRKVEKHWFVDLLAERSREP
ncbi:MAG TPA: hypothetical protein VM780_02455 [Hansschlegelia sp.]|nr:hypothetical protein [Hansschlegelia sp.]